MSDSVTFTVVLVKVAAGTTESRNVRGVYENEKK